MARIKRVVEQQNLSEFDFFVEDNDPNSRYFAVTDLPQTLTGGKNGFLITGTRELELGTTVKIEILDVDGNPLYYEIAQGRPEYYEGRSKVVSVWVYNDTPIGVGKITIIGELRKYYDLNGELRNIPAEWRGNYNVKWERPIMINSKLANETRVRFKNKPIINVSEIIANVKTRQTTTVQHSGSITGSAITPGAGEDWFRYRGDTDYRLKISGSTWNDLIVANGGTVEVSSLDQGYVTKIKKILSDTTALASTPYYVTSSNNAQSSTYKQVVGNFTADSFVATYTSESFSVDAFNEGTASFARVVISDLETFSGDVHRVKLYRRPIGSTVESDFELIQDQVIESRELLSDESKIGRDFRTGIFKDQSTVDTYWNTSSVFLTASQDDSVLFHSVYLTGSANVVHFASGSTSFAATYVFPTASSSDFVVSLLSYASRSLAGTSPYTSSVFYESQSIVNGVSQSYYVSESVQISVREFIANNGASTASLVLHEVSSSLVGTPPYVGSVYAYSSSIQNEYDLYYRTASVFTTGSEYNVSAFAIGYGEGALEVYLSGSAFYNRSSSIDIQDNGSGKLIGHVSINGGRVEKTFDDNFEPDTNGTGVLLFKARGGRWYIHDVSMSEYFETNFSPNRFETIIQSPTTINDQAYEFKAEFFDVNSNRINVTVISDRKNFFGGATGKRLDFTANKAGFTFTQPDISGSFTRTPTPTAQTVEFTTTTRGLLTGSVTYTSQAFDNTGTAIPASAYTTASYFTFLTNATHSVATEVGGANGDFSSATGSFKVYHGDNDLTTSSVFGLMSVSSGVTASIDADGLYTASLNATTDSGTAVFSASIEDTTYTQTFTLSKNKTGNSELLVFSATPNVISYVESASALPATDVVTFTIQQNGLSATVISGDFYVTKNDGTRIVTSSLSGTVVGGTGSQTFTASFNGNNSGSFTLTRADFPLTASVTKDSITDTLYLYSVYGADTYPGTMTDLTNSGGTLTVANFTGSSNGYVVDSVQFTASSEGISDTVTLLAFTDGASGRVFFIRPKFGTVLKNKDGGDPSNPGNLEIEIVKTTDNGLVSQSADLGNIKLYSASVELNTGLNGISAGSFLADVRYNARISGSAITGSLLLSAEDTGSGIVYDTITLADLQDGVPAGYVTAPTRVIKRNPNNNTYNISSLGLTASFYIPNQSDGTGITYNRYVSIDPQWNGTADQMSWSYDAGGSTNIVAVGSDLDGGTVAEDAYATTTDLSLTFTYTDPIYGNQYSTEETFYVVTEGLDGSGSINPVAHTILPLSGTFFSTNPNSGLHQPAWLEFRTQMTTSGSTYNITSGSTSYLRRQRDDLNITASGDGITYRVTKDEINSLEVFQWYSGSSPTVVDTISVSDITDGTNSVTYLIRPFFGTVLKNKDGGNPNSPGNLEIQLVKISGSQEYILDSGDVKLYSGSVELSAALNGVSAGTATSAPYNGSGTLPYHAQISGSAITGSLIISAQSASIIADTITLSDLQDGQPAGWVTANAGRVMTRDPQTNNAYTPSSLGVTGSFYIPDQKDGTGTTYSRYVGIDSNWNGTLDQMSWSYEPGGSSLITVTASDKDGGSVSAGGYSNTKDLSLTFTYTDPTYGTVLTTEETFLIVSDGTDGEAAPSVILQLDDNNRAWIFNSQANEYIPSDTTNGITASFYIGGTLTARRGWPISISNGSLLTGSEDTALRSDDWANVTITVGGGGTSNMSIGFESASIQAREQFSVIPGGTSPVAHTILPLSGTFFSTNPNSGLHQPAWLEFRTQMTTSGSTYNIMSGSTSYLRRQRDDFNITASGDGITYRLPKDEVNSLEVLEWYSGSSPTVVDTISVSDITDGTNSVAYLIRPFFGTVLKNKDGGNPNSPGNLELQLVKISGSQEYILNSGDVKLYSASVELSLALNGIGAGTATGAPYNGSGTLPYHARISGSAITGSLVIQAISSSVVADTITLSDLQDGQPAGWVTANAGRVMTRDPQANNSYTPSSLGITGSFYIPDQKDGTGTTYSRYVSIDSNWTGTLDQMSWSYEPGGSSNITVTASDKDGGSVAEDVYSNTKDLSLTFTYVDPTYGTVLTTEETFLIVSDGTDGEAAPSAIIRLDDNNRTWLYNPNNGSYTPSDTTNGITASFYIGDTLTAQRGWPISITANTLGTGSENTALRSGDWANTTIDVDGGGTKNMVIGFASGSIVVREQFNIVGEPRHTHALVFSPESKVVTAGPSGEVISGLPDTITVYLYVSGGLETDYTSWTWDSSSANLTCVHSADRRSFTISNFTPTSLEQAIVSVTASKAYDEYTTTLQGAFTVTKAYQGRQGPGVVYIGDYDDLANSWPLQNDDVRRDIVTHAGTYYYYTGSDGATKTAISADNGHPTGSNTTAYWGTFSNFAAVATDILLAQDAYIGRTLNIGTDKTTGEANIALNGQASIPYLSIGQATQNYAQSGVFLGSGSVSGKSAKFSISGSGGALLWNGNTLTIQGAIRQTSTGTAIGDARGDWTAGVQYFTNDIVAHAGVDTKTRLFRVKIDHTSDAGSTPSEIAAVDNTGDATSEARYELYIDTGAAGANGKVLSLSADSFVIAFPDTGDDTATPDVITFTVAQQNLAGTVTDPDLTITKNDGTELVTSSLSGTVTNGTGTQTATLSFSGNSLTQADMPITASVTKDSITDVLHIVKVVGGGAGADAKTVILTADSYIMAFDNAADNTATPDVITFTVAQQNLSATIQDPDLTITKNDGTQLITSSLSGTVVGGSGTQTATVSYSGNSLSKTDLPITASVTKDSITDTIHIFKVQGGETGATGPDGSDGYTVFLTNGTHVFPADASGSVADADEGAGAFEVRIFSGSTQLTYNAVGGAGTYTVGTLTYDPASNITLSATTNASQRRFTPTAVSNTYNSGSVTIPITDNNNSQTFDLVYTWAKSIAGQSSYTVLATNASHVFSADNAGTVSDYSGGGTRIVVYEGTTKMRHTTGTTADGEYKATVATANNITAGSVSTDNNEALVQAPSNMTANDASIYFNVEINPSIGTATFTNGVTQSFSKSTKGDAGNDGKVLIVTADSFVIAFPDTGDDTADPNVITFTVSQQNLSATVQDPDITITKNNGTELITSSLSGTVTNGTGTQTTTLSFSGNSLTQADMPITASVTKDSITDVVHIVKVVGGGAGADAKSLILTTDSNIFAFDDSADTTATPDIITFTVAQQNLSATVQDPDITITKNDGTELVTSSLAGTVVGGSGTQTTTLSYSGNSLSKTDLPITASVTKDSITDTIHVFKVEGGTNGTNGTDGEFGYTVFLTNGAHTFPADASGSVADADEGAGAFEVRVYSGSTQLTYAAGGGAGTYNVGTLVYDPVSNITLNQTTNSSQRRFTPTAVSNAYNSGSVTIPITDNNNSQAFDLVYTWAKAKAGQSAYTVFATNESHTFSANSAGTVSDYSGGGTRIIVYEGTDKLRHTTGTTGDGQYKVTVASANNITAGSVSTDNNEALVQAPSNMTANDASIYYNVEINPSIGTATFTNGVTQSFAKSKAGSSARGLVLTADSNIFAFDDSADTTATPNVITFTVSQQNLSATVVDGDFTVTKNNGGALTKGTLTGTVTDGTGTQTSTLSYSGNSLSKTDLPITASVTKDSITDTVHIFKVEGGADGSSAKSLILTVDSNIFSFDNAADTSADPNVLTFTVAQQNLSATVLDADFTVLKNNGAALSKGTLTGTVTSGTGTQTSTVSYSGNSLTKADLPLTASVTKDSITDTVHIYKVEGGTSGTNGTDGADGYTVFLTNGAHTFPADASGSVADAYEGAGAFETRIYSGSTQLTYNAAGGAGTYTVGTLTYDPASNITLSATTNASQRRFTPTAVSNTYDSGSVTVPITDNNNSQTFSLVYTWAKAKAGQSSYTVIATNQSHTFSANSAGTVSDYSGGGTRIVVYEGTNKLIHTTGTTGDGQYKVTVASANNITAGSVSTNNNEALVVAPSDMTADDASIYFNVEINPSIGTSTFNSSVTQSFAKSKQGDTGAGGDSGPGVVYRGNYSSTATYYSSSIRRDIVSHAGSYYLSNVNSTTAPTPPTNWTSFGAQFDSVATNILLAQYANITKGLVIGHSATELGGATNPSSSFIRTANATSLTTGQGFFLSSSGEFTIGDFDGARIAISGSTFIISGSNGSWQSDGALYATDATLLGFVSSSEGRMGGFDIGGSSLTSIGGSITLDGANESIVVRDSGGTVRFLANTETSLPNPSLTDTITANEDGGLADGGGGNPIQDLWNSATSGLTTNLKTYTTSFGSTPSYTGTYDFTATITANATTKKVYSGNSTLAGSAEAKVSVRLQILDVSNNIIAESATRTIQVDSISDGWNTTTTFPTSTFKVSADLTAGSTYKARWYVETRGGWFGAKAPTSAYPYSYFDIEASDDVTGTYDLSKTIVNGGGFQTAASSTKFFRVQNSTPAILLSGSAIAMSGSVEISENLSVLSDVTVTDQITANRIEVGNPSYLSVENNQLAVQGNLQTQGVLFVSRSTGGEVLAEFIHADLEGSGNEVGFFFGASSGSAAVNKKPYIAPIVGTGPNFNREFFFSVANDRWEFDDDLHVGGTLSKTAGSFVIPNPDPDNSDTYLWHSFVESPTAGDNLYRFSVQTENGIAVLSLDTYFEHLNENPQVWVSPVRHFGRAWGEVSGSTCTIHSDVDGEYNVLIIGTRKDEIARRSWKGVIRER